MFSTKLNQNIYLQVTEPIMHMKVKEDLDLEADLEED